MSATGKYTGFPFSGLPLNLVKFEFKTSRIDLGSLPDVADADSGASDFDFADFEYDAEEVTMLFSEDALKALADEMSEKVTMEYAGDEYGIDSYCCSYCEKEVIPDMYNYCPGCGRKIKEWK